MEIKNRKNLQPDNSIKLSKIISSPVMYPDFPQVPAGIFSSDGKLWTRYSLYKKWTAYYVLDDWKWEYYEGMDVLDASKIVFDFTQYELDSLHVGETLRNRVSVIIESSETQIFEEALRTVISKKLYNSLSSYFGNILSNKLFELSGLYGESMYSYLERISLIPLFDFYIVLDANIHFSRQELEQIKRAVLL